MFDRPSVAVFCVLLLPLALIHAGETYTVNPQLPQPIKVPACLLGKTFFVAELGGGSASSAVRMARSWTSPNPAWLPPGVNFNRELKMLEVNWQTDPADIVRDALVQSFRSANNLASDDTAADYTLLVTLFRFGLADATWREYYSKLEMLVQVKNMRTGAIVDVPAIGTCVAKTEDRDHKSKQKIESGLQTALSRGVTNFLYSARLKAAVE